MKGALFSWMNFPTTVDPVNEITRTLGCVTNGVPTFGPVPNTIFTTPGGTPKQKQVA